MTLDSSLHLRNHTMIPSGALRCVLPLLFLALAGCGETGGNTFVKAKERDCSTSDDPGVVAIAEAGTLKTSKLGLAPGRYALPPGGAPEHMVVMFHGHSNDSCSWRDHLRRVAADKNALTIAMDYPSRPQDGVQLWGWFVEEGAADSIEAAQHFLRKYPAITRVHAFGVSMGGHASGMAVAAAATRDDGSPLFDYWVGIEGVHNFTEAYLTYRAVAPGIADAQRAVDEMEEEAGGSLEEVPARYAELTNVFRAPDMGYLRGAVMVHGYDDGLVSTDQSDQMTAALNMAGVGTHLYKVLLRGSGEAGSTFSGTIVPYSAPTAGHGWEGDAGHIVMATGFAALYALMDEDAVSPGYTLVPGN
jgi:acetyl esterase/lipase